MFSKTGLSASIGLALAAPAIAQEVDSAGGAEIEEIIVTGSRLVRRDFSAPSPIQTIDADAMKFSGQPMLEEALNKLPQVSPDFSRTANNPGDGTARVNLRGLGSGRTLVMLNGRRLASSGIGSSVDVNSLPQALMQSVEVITGGATTVYGSDAVAGVVNFITRSDFDGFGLDASAYSTQEGDSTVYDATVTFGHQFSNGKGNITAYVGYYDREPLFSGERPAGQVEFFDTGFNELVPFGSAVVPEGVIFSPRIDYGNNRGPSRTTFDENGDPRAFLDPEDRYNYAPVNYLQVPLERYSGGIFANYDLTDRAEIYTELTYSHNFNRQNLAPVPFVAGLVVNLDNPVLSDATRQLFADNLFPVGPNEVLGFMGRRMLDGGARIIDNTNEYSRAVVGVRGELTDTWDYDAWFIYNKSEIEQDLLNAFLFSRFQQGLLVDPVTGQCFDPSNGCVPVDIFGPGSLSEEAVEFLRAPVLINPISRTQQAFSAFVRGELFATWAGPIQTAFGVEWRSDEGSFKADDLVFGGDVLGYTGDAPVDGEEDVAEVYAEAILPLAENMGFADYLALEVGGRYSEYKNAGSVESWKLGLEWVPTSSIRFRTMYQRSVRAPNLLEAFQETFSNGIFPWVQATPDEDPCSASADPIGTGRLDKCVLQGIPASEVGTWEATPGTPTEFFGGGNPELTPEVATTYTAGIVIQPESMPQLQLSFDYFDLQVEDTIGRLSAELACFDPGNLTGEFCDKLIRDPLTYDVVEIRRNQVNKGVLNTNGIDTQINWSSDLGAGDVVVDLIYTRMLENSFQETSFGTLFDCAGHFGGPCQSVSVTTLPRDRVTTNFNYTNGDFNTFLNWRWIGSSTIPIDIITAQDPVGPHDYVITKIDDANYFDLGFGYQFNDNIVGRLVIANVTDRSPAFMASWGRAANTDPGMYDIFGRSFTLSVSLQY